MKYYLSVNVYMFSYFHHFFYSYVLLLHFTDLFKRASDDNARRDYLYYMSVGYTRIKVRIRNLRTPKLLLLYLVNGYIFFIQTTDITLNRAQVGTDFLNKKMFSLQVMSDPLGITDYVFQYLYTRKILISVACNKLDNSYFVSIFLRNILKL